MWLTKMFHSLTFTIVIIRADYVSQSVLNMSPKSCTKKGFVLKYTGQMLHGTHSIP